MQKSAIATTGIALLSSNVVNALTDNCPYEGYNPYTDTKTDMRTVSFGQHIKVKGSIYDKTGLSPISNAKIEVWHLSPNSSKFRHRGKLKTNAEGEYSFITDFPDKEQGKSHRIYFKVSNTNKTYFTELILGSTSPSSYITSKHWEENQELGKKLMPVSEKFLNTTTINFNISI